MGYDGDVQRVNLRVVLDAVLDLGKQAQADSFFANLTARLRVQEEQ